MGTALIELENINASTDELSLGDVGQLKSGSLLPNMQLTERDIKILEFINDFGFCEMPQIEKMFNLVKPRSYQIIQRLLRAGLVKHERVFHGRHGIYRLSSKGASYTALPAMARVALGNYNHSVAVIDVYLYLQRTYPKAQWLSERQLKHEKYFNGVGKSGHLSDGILLLANDNEKEKKIAIEVELRSKSKARIQAILKWYSSQFDFSEVWYFCPEGVAEAVRSSVSDSMKFVKIFSLRGI